MRVSTACLAPVACLSACGPLRTLGFGRAGRLDALRARFLDAMRAGAVLLLPVFATTARRHGFSWGPYGNLGLTLVFNALGLPAAAVPLGVSRDRLPLSVQIVARPGEDEVALAVAAVLASLLWFAAAQRPSSSWTIDGRRDESQRRRHWRRGQ